MMIKLKPLLLENTVKLASTFIANQIHGTKWQNKVYAAGGAPRDHLIGVAASDLDLLVNGKDGGIKFAIWLTKKLKIYKKNSNPVVYKKFGVAKFNLRGIKYKGKNLSKIDIEAVMPRSEKYKKGSRKPIVSYSDLESDVKRRDLTINSLLQNLTTGEILDLTGLGKSDIKSGIVRTPVNPDVIFKEDPLRMLRCIRYTVKYNWKLPLFMIKSLKKNAKQLKNISMERIRDELNKMLVTGYPDKAIKLMRITGLNKYVIPELDKLHKLKQNKYHKYNAKKHTLEVLKNVPPKLATRLAALMHDIGKSATRSVVNKEVHFYRHEAVSADMARDIMLRLKYPNDIITKVTTAIRHHMRTKQAGPKGDQISDKALRKLKHDLGDHLEDTLDVIASDNIAHHPDYNMPDQVKNIRKRLKDLDDGSGGKIKLPVNGTDLMLHFNVKPGPVIGKMLNAIKNAWFANPKLTKRDAYKVASKILRKMK